MVTFRNSWLRGLRGRLGLLVAGPRRRHQLLHLALANLSADTRYISFDWDITPREAQHVLRLLHRHIGPTAGGLGPIDVIASRALVEKERGAVQGDSSAGHITFQEVFDPYQQEPAGYISHTAGGWLATLVDCE